jgi:hypothetical protein
MILDAIKKNELKALERGWKKTYWFIDIHETLIVPNYKYGDIPKEFYPWAKKTMQMLSSIDEICLIMYTCSWPEEILQYNSYFEENGIHFDYVNENPEVSSAGYGCYDKKPYINVLLDDKAGFNPESDWKIIFDYIKGLKPKKELEVGKIYQTKMQTKDMFRVESLLRKNDGSISRVMGIYLNNPEIGICPIDPDRLIND